MLSIVPLYQRKERKKNTTDLAKLDSHAQGGSDGLVFYIWCSNYYLISGKVKMLGYWSSVIHYCYGNINWRASVASETLAGVKMKKSGMFIYLFVYMFGRTYVILYFDPRVFVLVMWSTPSQIALNRILLFSDQYPYHPRN